MPDEAPEVLDVNTDEGFNRALAAATGNELTPEHLETLKGSDRSVASGLEFPESAPARDPETGQFVAKPAADPAPAAPEGAAPATQEPPAATDPLEAILSKLSPEEAEAIKKIKEEADNAQSLIGRQGNEVGELREKLARIEGRLEATPEAPQAPAQFVPFSQIEAAILESEDPEEAAPGVMAWVIEHGTDDQIDQTLKVWKQVDPVGAADFAARKAYFEEAARAEAERGEQPAAPAEDPWVAQKKLDEEIAGSLAAVLKDVSPEERTALAPYLSRAWDSAPSFLKQAMTNPENRAEVLGQLVVTARANLTHDVVAAAKAAGDPAPKVEVVSGANQNPLPPEGGGNEQRTPEEVSKALQKALLETDTTSVSSGLTYGQAAPQQ